MFRSKFCIQTSNFFHHIKLSYTHNFLVTLYQFQHKLSTLEVTKHGRNQLCTPFALAGFFWWLDAGQMYHHHPPLPLPVPASPCHSNGAPNVTCPVSRDSTPGRTQNGSTPVLFSLVVAAVCLQREFNKTDQPPASAHH